MDNACCETIIRNLEECIDLVDKLVRLYSRVNVGEEIKPSFLFQLYVIITDLREKIVETRMSIYRYCRGNESSCSNY